ncbi:MAG: hypothetical protein ACP5VE_10630 [Chthonomonadales bacterium]
MAALPTPIDAPVPVPGTAHLGILFLEAVQIQRRISGAWTPIASGVPATFEPVSIHTRAELAAFTHKPLLCLWLYPAATLQDGDRVVRADGSGWYVRGTPFLAPRGTHYAVLVEGELADTLFAPPAP